MATDSDRVATNAVETAQLDNSAIQVVADDNLTGFLTAYVAEHAGRADDWDEFEGGRKIPPKAITFAITLVAFPEPGDTRDVFAKLVADDIAGYLREWYDVPSITFIGTHDTTDPGDGTTDQPEPITVIQTDADTDDDLQDIPY